MSKLSLQAIRIPPWLGEIAPALKSLKLVDPPQDNPWPGVQTIIRTPDHDGMQNRFIHLGADGADAWWLTYGPFFRARAWAWAVEVGNEPDTSESALPAWAAFTRRAVDLLHEHDLRAVVGNFAVGTPQLKRADPTSRAWEIIAPALEGADYLGLHEYGPQSMTDSYNWFALRHRLAAEELAALGVTMPRVLITECGIDGGNRQGWRAFADSEEHYLAQLGWYNGALGEDEYVEAAYLYTAGPTWDWESFEITERIARAVASWGGVALLSTPPIIAESRNVPPASKNTVGEKKCYIHHTAIIAPVENIVAQWKRQWGDDGWPHRVVDVDGWVHNTWPLDRDGVGVLGHNAGTRHIEIVGTFTDHIPDAVQWAAAVTATADVLETMGWGVETLHPHRDDQATECPGQAFVNVWEQFVSDVRVELTARAMDGGYDDPPEGTPDRPLAPTEAVLDKATWWAEELLRALESGNTLRALELAKDNAAWLAKVHENG